MDIRQRLRRDRDRHDGHHPAIFMREDVAVHYEDTPEIKEPGSHREVSVDDDGIAVGRIVPRNETAGPSGLEGFTGTILIDQSGMIRSPLSLTRVA